MKSNIINRSSWEEFVKILTRSAPSLKPDHSDQQWRNLHGIFVQGYAAAMEDIVINMDTQQADKANAVAVAAVNATAAAAAANVPTVTGTATPTLPAATTTSLDATNADNTR